MAVARGDCGDDASATGGVATRGDCHGGGVSAARGRRCLCCYGAVACESEGLRASDRQIAPLIVPCDAGRYNFSSAG
jgi:hypothetical protein